MHAVIYIHGKGGNASESVHYKSLFPESEVIGLDYKSFTPGETGKEIHTAIKLLKEDHEDVVLIANSIGAYFSMNSDIDKLVQAAYFISPIVDMERLILNMMNCANVSESELRKKGVINTMLGENLSWEYLCYVREHPIKWNVPTHILYGSHDDLISLNMITDFAARHNTSLTIMENGEHWFHTEEQMRFVDNWIINTKNT